MPTYEFTCPQGHDFEKFYRSITAAPSEIECPVCGVRAPRKVSAGSGLLFKGSGFYITDYGKDGKKDQRKPPSDATPGEKKASGETSGGTAQESPKPSTSSTTDE